MEYFWRAIAKQGRLIDVMLSDRRNPKAATRFPGKALKIIKDWPPSSITTDRLASYPRAIRRLKRERKLADAARHRTSKDRNNVIAADHGALKPMIRRGHRMLKEPGAKGEVRFVNNLFGIAA